MHFTAHYQETIVLRDGANVELRLIRPDDKQGLRQILAGMSPRSRMMRFFIARGDFNERELRYLTELDGANHLAILAVCADQPIGVARFIRLERGGRIAEPAFSVIDACHGRGLGRALVGRLAAAARERGIARFEAEVLPENRAMLRLLCELDGSIPPRGTSSHASITCAVDLLAPASPAYLRQAA